MGGEVKTNVSDDFKALETEMNLRHDGKLMTELHAMREPDSNHSLKTRHG